MSQSISGVPVGDSYYVTAQVKRLGLDAYCVFDMSVGSELLVSHVYFNDQADSCEPFHASGVSGSADIDFVLSYYYYGDGKDPVDIWAAFDNVALFIYPATLATSSSATSSATPATTSSSESSVTPSATPIPSPVGT